VYRKELQPVISTGAEVMDSVTDSEAEAAIIQRHNAESAER